MSRSDRAVRWVSLACFCISAPATAADLPGLPGLERAGASAEGKGSLLANPSLVEPSRTLDVQHYSLAITLDFPSTSIEGTVAVDAIAEIDGLVRVDLDMGENLIVDEITSEGGTLGYARDGDRLSIELPDAVAEGEAFSFTVAYHGTGNVFPDFGLVFSSHETGPNIWTFVEPEGARLWFPCVDHPYDKATFDLTATIDEALVATSNGPPVDVRAGEGTRTWRFEHPFPISTYLIVFNASNFAVIEDEWTPPGATDPMPITHYVYPQLLDPATEDFSITPYVFDLLTEWFGPYPFVETGYSHTLFPWPGAMEHQTNTSYGAGLITGTHEFDSILVHEVAHQWFGDRVGPADWTEIWLNEGFATYAEALFLDVVFSEQFGFDVMPLVMDAFLNVYFQFHDGPDHAVWGPPEGHIFCVAEYYKGACILHMLRKELGDDNFFTALRSYSDDGSPQSARSQDFRMTAEDVSGRDLRWFFDQWVYGPGYPVLEYSWTASTAVGAGSDPWIGRGGPQVTIDFEQVQEWAPFRLPIDVRVFAGEDVIDETYVMDTRIASHTIPLPAEPDSLFIDPENWLFAPIFEQTGGDLVAVPESNFGDAVFVTPNPFRGAVAIRVPLADGEEMVLRIFDANGRQVRSFPHVHADTVEWDGRTGAGAMVPPGMYFLEVHSPSGTTTDKILKLR